MRLFVWLYRKWTGLGAPARVSMAAVLVLGLGTASVVGYRQYNYMMHDNEFCLSCHLMTDAFERFQRSAHNELSCHSCHPAGPNTVWQLYATVFLNPTDVKKHAHVPDRTCERCHVLEGDTTSWRRVRETAGHRIHLESQDSALRDVACVTCHSNAVHEFNPTNQTCMEAGCHPDAKVQLGRMGSLDIYCTTCHSFNAITPQLAFDSLGAPLSPKVQQCYACHEMRQQLGEMEFLHDPHKGECGMCHNPHEQRTGSDARATCATASCHPDTQQSPFHVGVPNPGQCTTCHLSHSWKVEGANCTRCHQTITHDRGPARAPRAAAPAPASALQHAGSY